MRESWGTWAALFASAAALLAGGCAHSSSPKPRLGRGPAASPAEFARCFAVITGVQLMLHTDHYGTDLDVPETPDI